MRKIFFQRAWQRLLFLVLLTVVNLSLFMGVAWLWQKSEIKALPTEVLLGANPSNIAFAPPNPTTISQPTKTTSLSPSPSPTISPSETASPSSTLIVSTLHIPSITPIPSIIAFNVPQVPIILVATAPQVQPMVVVNPNEAIPTYATVPAGLEEFAQASFRYVYGQRSIRSLSADQRDVHIGFVLDMTNLDWDTNTGLVRLACNLWRNGFAKQTYIFIGYQENLIGLDVSYQEKMSVNLSAMEVPQMPCAAPESLDLSVFADFYWLDF